MILKTMLFLMGMFSSIIVAGLMVAFINDLIEKLWQLRGSHRVQKQANAVIVLPVYRYQPQVQDTEPLPHVTIRSSATTLVHEAEPLAKAA